MDGTLSSRIVNDGASPDRHARESGHPAHSLAEQSGLAEAGGRLIFRGFAPSAICPYGAPAATRPIAT